VRLCCAELSVKLKRKGKRKGSGGSSGLGLRKVAPPLAGGGRGVGEVGVCRKLTRLCLRLCLCLRAEGAPEVESGVCAEMCVLCCSR
jgi:hypothetical protein